MIGHICNCRVPSAERVVGNEYRTCGALCDNRKYGSAFHIQEPWGPRELSILLAMINNDAHRVCRACLRKFLDKVAILVESEPSE